MHFHSSIEGMLFPFCLTFCVLSCDGHIRYFFLHVYKKKTLKILAAGCNTANEPFFFLATTVVDI